MPVTLRMSCSLLPRGGKRSFFKQWQNFTSRLILEGYGNMGGNGKKNNCQDFLFLKLISIFIQHLQSSIFFQKQMKSYNKTLILQTVQKVGSNFSWFHHGLFAEGMHSSLLSLMWMGAPGAQCPLTQVPGCGAKGGALCQREEDHYPPFPVLSLHHRSDSEVVNIPRTQQLMLFINTDKTQLHSCFKILFLG